MQQKRDRVQELAELLELCLNECAGDKDKGFALLDQVLEFEPDLVAFMTSGECGTSLLREVARRALARSMNEGARALGLADYDELVAEVARGLRAANRLH